MCAIIWQGKAKWHEIMSMFPTELAADTTLRTSETKKKHQKDIVFQRQKIANICNSYEREKPNGTK